MLSTDLIAAADAFAGKLGNLATLDTSRVDNGALTLVVTLADELTWDIAARRFALPITDHMNIDTCERDDGVTVEVVWLLED